MGKKTKVGKDRKDKFYKLAKETGYRSRAAFKLIQLNRRFGFLQQSQVCVDLCAAPGGWMQVAKNNMPVSSIVIGIDLFPIKSIPGCLSLTEDITTEKCRQALIKELKTWKVDVFLNDGAPNVGKNWLFDAYQQICLSLSALKLTTEFLRPGGWFITKVFRSKDYNAFIWVLKQLFKKVFATKPSASRKESAEIFVVCQGYKAPAKIDPKYMDPKYVFEELEIDPVKNNDVLKDTTTIKKAKAIGYDSIDVRKILTITDFLKSKSALEALQIATEFRFDEKKIEDHPLTTVEIKECVKDIKVLGRKDLKDLIKWWKKMKEIFYPGEKKVVEENSISATNVSTTELECQEMDEIDNYVNQIKLEEEQDEKRKKKKITKVQAKAMQKISLKMTITDGGPQDTGDEHIFNLKEIEDAQLLNKVAEGADLKKSKSKRSKKQRSKVPYDGNDLNDDEIHIPRKSLSEADYESDEKYFEDMGFNENFQNDFENEENSHLKKNRNPLIADLDYRDKNSKRLQKAQLWFEKDTFEKFDKCQNLDENMDLNKLMKSYKKKGIEIIGEPDAPDLSKLGRKARQRAKHEIKKETSSESESEEELIDTQNQISFKKIKLSEEELALGQLLISSKKTKRDLIDGAWNRYTFNDENLPEWFIEDEKNAMKRSLPVPEDLVQGYRNNLSEFNRRSIKKVMEAKTRKKRRDKKKLEKLSKKAATILDNTDHSGQEKVKMLKKLYKKTEKKKQEVAYVVAKKTGISGRKVSRPAGVKGRFKVVDPRMKKDLRTQKKKIGKGPREKKNKK